MLRSAARPSTNWPRGRRSRPRSRNFVSYCRCVEAQRLSNGKKKAANNAKNGNEYLAWAFVEAAYFAVRYYPEARRFHDRKAARTNRVVADLIGDWRG